MQASLIQKHEGFQDSGSGALAQALGPITEDAGELHGGSRF